MRGTLGKSLGCITAAIWLVGCASIRPSTPEVVADEPALDAEPAMAPEDILGRSAAALDDILGAPALVRHEGPGEYRRYAYKDCALIVILYPDETGAPKVAHVDAAALNSDEENPDPAACLASVR